MKYLKLLVTTLISVVLLTTLVNCSEPDATLTPISTLTPGCSLPPVPTYVPTLEPFLKASVDEVRDKLYGGHGIIVIDVRSKEDYYQGHIGGAISMPLEELPNRYAEIPQEAEVFIYAQSA
ncbi:rhodanese-like domain-containing protein [Chloroflexota bacterium]